MDLQSCFICADDCTSSFSYLVNLLTKKFKTKYTQLIGFLINNEYELRISKDDKICNKCCILIERYDELQNETKTVKSILSRQIANTYNIETDEKEVYMDKSKVFAELRSLENKSTKYSCKICPRFVTENIDTVNSHIIYHKIIAEDQQNPIAALNTTVRKLKKNVAEATEIKKAIDSVKQSCIKSDDDIESFQEDRLTENPKQISSTIKFQKSSNAYDEDLLDSLIDLNLLDNELFYSNLKDTNCSVDGCNQLFIYACDYVRHLKLKHKSTLNHIFAVIKSNLKRPSGITKFTCPYCFTKMIDSQQLEEHVKQHEEGGKSNLFTDRINDFICNIIRTCRCKICNFGIHETYISDCNHDIAKNNMKHMINCLFCSQFFYNEKLYNNHLALDHRLCFICNFECDNRLVLRDHIISHLNHTDYSCQFCKDVFQTKKKRLDHIKLKHNKQCCAYCDEWYTNQSDLKHHTRYAHADKRCHEKASVCDDCGASFKNKQLYECHIQMDHKTRKIYKCSACSQEFRFRYLLMEHVANTHNRTVIDNETNFYKCCFCINGFSSQNRKEFIQHLQKHYMNSSFCYDCNTNTESTHYLEAHRERIHQDFSKSVDKNPLIDNKLNMQPKHVTTLEIDMSNLKQTDVKTSSLQKKNINNSRQFTVETVSQTQNLTANKQQIESKNRTNIDKIMPEHSQYQQKHEQIVLQSNHGNVINMNNLILTENGELIIQNLDGLLQNGSETDEGTPIQISNLEQFLIEQGLSSNSEISYIQPNIIPNHDVMQNEDSTINNNTSQGKLLQTYKEIFESDDDISSELVDTNNAPNMLLNGEYIVQSPYVQQNQNSFENIEVPKTQTVVTSNQSTLDELGDILLEVAAAAEKEKKPKASNQRAVRESLWGKKRQLDSSLDSNVKHKRSSSKQPEPLDALETHAKDFSQAYEFFVRGFDAKKQKQL